MRFRHLKDLHVGETGLAGRRANEDAARVDEL